VLVRRLEVLQPANLAEALEFKSDHGDRCRIIAGGTDQMIALREEPATAQAAVLMDISGLGELKGITQLAAEDGCQSIRVGALASHTDIETSSLICEQAKLLAHASAEVGSPQIRNMGTIGGNICNGAPCADTLPALLALDGTATVESVRGKRNLPVAELLPEPYNPTLAADEIVISFEFRAPAATMGTGFVKLGRRNALSLSRMSIAVILDINGTGKIDAARIAAGSVAPAAVRFPEIEAYLKDREANSETFETAGKAMADAMIAVTGRRWSTPYKEPVVASLLIRALELATMDREN
jgi:CO/xanthine dehydrogenase FAD-binding subunit